LIDPTVSPSSGWFSFEGLPLKWHHPIGLLYDLFSGAAPALSPAARYTKTNATQAEASSPLPWRLVVHFSSYPSDQLVQLDEAGKAVHDAFTNSVKEADFLRTGTAKPIMALSKDDSTALWDAVVSSKLSQCAQSKVIKYLMYFLQLVDNLPTYASIYNSLLPASHSLRYIPLRIYLPSSDLESTLSLDSSSTPQKSTSKAASGHLKVVQSLIPPFIPSTREPQTLGMVLNSLIPAMFPSRRRTVLARPVLHGAVVPLTAVVEELMRGAAYADGWVSLGIDMII
jgi:autophagy-related protein 5